MTTITLLSKLLPFFTPDVLSPLFLTPIFLLVQVAGISSSHSPYKILVVHGPHLIYSPFSLSITDLFRPSYSPRNPGFFINILKRKMRLTVSFSDFPKFVSHTKLSKCTRRYLVGYPQIFHFPPSYQSPNNIVKSVLYNHRTHYSYLYHSSLVYTYVKLPFWLT